MHFGENCSLLAISWGDLNCVDLNIVQIVVQRYFHRPLTALAATSARRFTTDIYIYIYIDIVIIILYIRIPNGWQRRVFTRVGKRLKTRPFPRHNAKLSTLFGINIRSLVSVEITVDARRVRTRQFFFCKMGVCIWVNPTAASSSLPSSSWHRVFDCKVVVASLFTSPPSLALSLPFSVCLVVSRCLYSVVKLVTDVPGGGTCM